MRVPGGGTSCLGVGRPGSGGLPPPTSRPFGLAAGAHYPLAVGAGGAGVGTRHQPHSARSCALWARHEGARGGRFLPGCAASGVGRSPTPDHSSFRACGRGPRPTGCGCGGCGRGDPSPTPQRALLRAGFARCGGGTRAPGGGASCLGVGRPWWGALPPPTTRPFGRAAGARFPLAMGAVCGRGGPAVLGTLSRAAVRRVLCALPGFAAPGGRCGLEPVLVPWLWPAACLSGVPRSPAWLLVRSGRSQCSGRLSRRRVAFPHPGGCCPRLYWVAARGTWRPAENRTHCACRWPLPRQGRWARSASYPFGACDGVVPGGSLRLRSWAACAALVWRVWTRSLTRPVSRTVRLSTSDSAGAPGLFRVDADTASFGSEDATPGSRACVCACSSWPGRAGQPPGRVLARLTFPLAVLGWLFACSAPSGQGLPRLWLLLGFFFCFFFTFLFSFPCFAPVVSCFACFPAPGALGLGVLSPPPLFFPPPPPSVRPVVACFSCFPALGSLGLGVLSPPPPPPPRPPPFFFFALPPTCCLWRFLLSCCLGPLRPPPLFFFCFLFSLLFLPVVRCGAGLCVLGRRVCPRVPRWCCPCRCSVCAGWCCVVLAVGPCCPVLSPGGSWCRASVVLSLSGRVARRPVVRRGVSWCSAALCCVLLRCAVVWWCAVVACACCLFLAAARLLCVFWGVMPCVPCSLRPVRCSAALC